MPTKRELVDQLKESPLFAMSHGSMELYHTNFWAWIMEKSPSFLTFFFPEIDATKKYEICREEGHRDITIWTNDRKNAYVIENKIKSIPTNEQLKGYSKALDSLYSGGVLTGIKEPNFVLEEKWRFISYSKIVEKLNECAEQDFNHFEKDVIKQYVRDVECLTQLIKEVEKDESKLLSWEDYIDVEEVRMADICQKLNACKFENYLIEELKESFTKQLEGTGFNFTTGTSFYRKSALIDCRLIKGKDESEIAIGIQIQHGQYRLGAWRKTRTIKKDFSANTLKEALFNEFLSYGWFNEKAEKTIEGKETSMRRDFCSYGDKTAHDNAYHMVYQYFKITDFSFVSLKENIKNHLERALKIIKDNNL